jgi:SulP family sulfate permease
MSATQHSILAGLLTCLCRILVCYYEQVLVGCIGGIGVFIAKTGLEVTLNDAFSIDAITNKWHLLVVVFFFEVVLRIMERITKDDHGQSFI